MLTDKQLDDIETLQKQCEVDDNLQLKLNWEMLRKRESDHLDFLYYEQNKLIAFLGLYAETTEPSHLLEITKKEFERWKYFAEKMDIIAFVSRSLSLLLLTGAGNERIFGMP